MSSGSSGGGRWKLVTLSAVSLPIDSSYRRNHCTFPQRLPMSEPSCWKTEPRSAIGWPEGESHVTRSTISPGGRKNLTPSSSEKSLGCPITLVLMHLVVMSWKVLSSPTVIRHLALLMASTAATHSADLSQEVDSTLLVGHVGNLLQQPGDGILLHHRAGGVTLLGRDTAPHVGRAVALRLPDRVVHIAPVHGVLVIVQLLSSC
eukprot:scaffold26918_cov63-Phaeocystis_antarctica.AAC.3